jgi:sugar phosphate isomerase/epimerase
MTRREACALLLGAAAAPCLGAVAGPFRLNYILASALYGTMPLAAILPEVVRAGASSVDVWCLKHGNQREQVDEMGLDAFAELLRAHRVTLGAFTRYPLGPFGLQDELKIVKKLGGRVLVTGSGGPKGLAGDELKKAVQGFVEKMKPHAAAAEEAGVTIAIENHGGSLLSSPDSIRWFAEFNRSRRLGVAFAPHHLHDAVEELPRLIADLGPQLAFFYAQERGLGFTEALGIEKEILQMPGRGGGLDYRPLLAALRKIRYDGDVEIFMHPTPRGIPIYPTAAEVTAAVNVSREYLDRCCRELD